ncbi:DUF2177 family protein [Acidiphilium sp. PA]|uniref:DUF2177 family protein n=1 Tax=Acidiphilium sp. PA TaxID=2871705 RepID=UPI0022438BBF|nr:DUF2177 family protein [Acidiphilium sp. PA]MCW8305610.1 DUF2177 family protein [Acidiphilium sp. PA]
MRGRIGLYCATLVAFLVMDAVWLSLTSAPLYRATLGGILLAGFKPVPALAVYLLEVLGLMVFVMPRARASGRASSALGYGALFGMFTYGLYDLTNDATLQHWTLELTLIDMAWGAVVCGVASTIGWLVAGRFSRQRLFT